MHVGVFDGPFGPLNYCPSHGSPVLLIKFHIVLSLRFLTSSGSEEKNPNKCLSVTRASHSHKMGAEVSSSAPHLLHEEMSTNHIM